MLFPKSSSSSKNSNEERQASYRVVDEMIDQFIVNYNSTLNSSYNRQHSRWFIERNREEGRNRLFNDYFAPNAVYPPNMFRKRFRKRRDLFLRIMEGVSTNDQFFQQRPNACGRMGLSTLEECTAALRMLAYGVAADATDEYLRIGGSTTNQCLKSFVEGVINHFGAKYLRRPNAVDMQKLLSTNEERGFPGMIGSIDFMHWEWKNCPAAWKGQYQGRSGKATTILEAVASQDLWIWHAFFGIPGSCNDLNVLCRSPVFYDVMNGWAPPTTFIVNGNQYNMCYYLTDGIYPQWAAFIPGITHPQTHKHRLFAERQAALRKDVERPFGVLQARFAIIKRPSLAWDEDILDMRNIMMACIIMHNMIVEDERDTYVGYANPTEFNEFNEKVHDSRPTQRRRQTASSSTTIENDGSFAYNVERPFDLAAYLAKRTQLHDMQAHQKLKADLIEHNWHKYGRHN